MEEKKRGRGKGVKGMEEGRGTVTEGMGGTGRGMG